MMTTKNCWENRETDLLDSKILGDALELLLDDSDEVNSEEGLPSPTSIGSDSTSEKCKKKSSRRPSYKVHFIPQLRILKRDIRRKYMSILCNVINSHDEELFCRFLSEFASPDCYLRLSLPMLGLQLTLYLEDLKNMFSLLLECSPDFIFGITSVQIYQRLHELGSKVCGHFTFEGVLLYLFSGMQPSLASFLSFSHQMSRCSQDLTYQLECPETMQGEGTIILHLDNHRHLVAIEAEVC